MIYWIQFCFKNLKFDERKNIRNINFVAETEMSISSSNIIRLRQNLQHCDL